MGNVTILNILKKLKKIKKDKNKRWRLLFLGTLDREKGFIDFIKSATYVKEKEKNVKFIVAGRWYGEDNKDETLRVVEKNKLGNFVRFVGVVKGKEKKELLENSDIFVFPTYFYEGQGIVAIEAMMAGLPVITTGRGGLKEMIKVRKNLNVD